MTYLIILTALIIAWCVYEVLTAPEGYEDASGWHPGPDPLDDVGRRLPDADGFVAARSPFHSSTSSPEAQRNHG
jgi:hypothetical protein